LSPRPVAQFRQGSIGNFGNLATQRIIMPGQLCRRMRRLHAGADQSGTAQTLAGLNHIGRADAKTLGDRSRRQALRRKHPITQILPVGLSTPPTHQSLQ